MDRGKLGAILAAVALLVAACTPAAQATSTPIPARTAVPATATPTRAPAPGPTTAAVTATPTSRPTAAPATGSTPKYGGTLRAFNRDYPNKFDPHKQFSGASELRNIEHSVFSQVLGSWAAGDKSCDPGTFPDLAESWKWTNANTLELKLRQGVKFQNKPPLSGRELTSEDVVWSFKRMLTLPGTVGQYGPFIKDIVAPDRYTVQIQTERTLAALIPAMGDQKDTSILGKEAGDYSKDPKWGDWEVPDKTFIGTGPFMWESGAPGVRAVLIKNPDYYKKGQPYIDRLDFVTIADMATRQAALISGKIDLIHDAVPMTMAFAARKTSPQTQVFGCPSGEPLFLFPRVDQKPFDDIRVRRALYLAIDQNTLVKTAFIGEGTPAWIVPPLHEWYIKAEEYPASLQKYFKPDVAEAKKLLAEAGYPQGFEVTLHYLPAWGSPFVESQETAVAMLAQVGIKVTMKPYERGRFYSVLDTGDYDGLLGSKGSGPQTPQIFLTHWLSTNPAGVNRPRIRDPELDKLILAFQSALDPATAKDLAKQIQIKLVDNAYFLLLSDFNAFAMAGPAVRNFVFAGKPENSRWWAEKVWLER